MEENENDREGRRERNRCIIECDFLINILINTQQTNILLLLFSANFSSHFSLTTHTHTTLERAAGVKTLITILKSFSL